MKMKAIPPDRVFGLGEFEERYSQETASATRNGGKESYWLENVNNGRRKLNEDIHSGEFISRQKGKVYNHYARKHPDLEIIHLRELRCGKSLRLVYALISGLKNQTTGKHLRVIGILDCLTHKEYDRICGYKTT
jgi:hypothetical protein